MRFTNPELSVKTIVAEAVAYIGAGQGSGENYD